MGRIIAALLVPESISHLAGADNYTVIHLWSGFEQTVAKELGYFEKQLPTFVRIHKSMMVNPLYVVKLQPPTAGQAGAVVMQKGVILPISRRRWAQVTRRLAVVSRTTTETDRPGLFPDTNSPD